MAPVETTTAPRPPAPPVTWRFRARETSGASVEGTVEADTEATAIQRVLALGHTPIEVSVRSTSALDRELRIPGLSGRIRRKDLAVVIRQLSTMVSAGLPVLRALTVLARETSKPELGKVLTRVADDVGSGRSLSDALSRHPKVFDRLIVAMVRAGETGGQLDEVLDRLATTLERQVELRRRVRSALAYPVAVAGLVFVMFGAMLLFVVPMFQDMYDDLDAPLPLPTRLLLGVSGLATQWWWVGVLAAGAGVWWWRRASRRPGGRAAIDRSMLRLPLVGSLVHRSAIARVATTTAALLRAGVPILTTLDIARTSAGNEVIGDAVARARELVEGGTPLAAALRREPVMPSMLVELVAVGEETGAVDELLDRAATAYEQEVSATVDGLTSLLEPLLVTVIGVGVGAMVVALYLPMFQLVNLVH